MHATEQTAIVQVDGGESPDSLPVGISQNSPLPPLRPGHVLIHTLAVALNPFDYKMAKYFQSPGTSVGCDFCGTVIDTQRGAEEDATIGASRINIDDRVCGSVVGNNSQRPQEGAFMQYIVAEAALLVRVPPDWSDVEAAALGGIGWKTAALALWEPTCLGLPGRPLTPAQEEQLPVVIYGGATASGSMMCQLLRLNGYLPIAVTSVESAPLAVRYGAVATVSYTSPSCVQDIQKAVKAISASQSLRHVVDCITNAESAAICMAALGRVGGRYVCLEAFDESWRTRRAVQVEMVMCPDANGVALNIGPGPYTRVYNQQRHALGIASAEQVQELLSKGMIKSHPFQELEGGWGGILKGLEMLHRGAVRGKKLVVRVPP